MNRNQALYFGMIALVVGLCIGVVSNAQSATAATKSALQPGQASGALTVGDSTVKLSNAGVFVDKKDERKPTVLVLSDQVLPLSGWADSSDMIMYRMEHKFNGVAFWLDEKHEVFRTEFYMPGVDSLISNSLPEPHVRGNDDFSAVFGDLPIQVSMRF